MLISYKWLQSYFDEKLPPLEVLAERISFAFAEVEAIEAIANTERDGTKPTRNETEKDYVFDSKVLPDRACYALSHRGVAYEVGAILGLKRKEFNWPQPEVQKTRKISVKIEAPELCSRYMARAIEGITPKELPWMKEHLEAIGQRSINPVVDGANLVMFDMGQPLHAFDADKVEGGIIVRRAHKGEKITTLDNREVALDESVLIIADEKSPLAIAGIKGGKKAEVTDKTKNLILESANFNAPHIRRTSERLGIKTDASKRFENHLSPKCAADGMKDFSAYLFEMDKNISAGEVIDVYSDILENIRIEITPEYISEKLGIHIGESEAKSTFRRLDIEIEKKGKKWIVTPPTFRTDLRIPEDLAEEVARIIGYDKIPSVLPPKAKEPVHIPKEFYSEWKIREILTNAGFSEVMTSSFSEKGDIAIEKPLAEDKKYARQNLRSNFEQALKMNALNAPLFGKDEMRIFEIGRVFGKDGEQTALAVGYVGPEKKSNPIQETLARLEESGIEISGEESGAIFEGSFSTRLNLVEKWDIFISPTKTDTFTPFSLFPFIARDIALFVQPRTAPETVAKIIQENAGALVVRGPELFDEFSKDGKKSLAFRLVFQSFERTLSGEEVNKAMEKIYSAVKGAGWEVR